MANPPMASHASLRILALSALGLCTASAQVPDAPAPAGAPAPAPAAGGAAKPKAVGSPFGQEIPVLDPGSEVMTFNGKNWNISNNRIFQARFEKFLNAPEATTGDEAAYRQIIDRILAGMVHPAQGDGLHVILQIQPASEFLHEFHGALAVDPAGRQVGRIAGIQDLVEAAQRVGVDPVLAAGQNVRQPERLHGFGESAGALRGNAGTPLGDPFQTQSLLR